MWTPGAPPARPPRPAWPRILGVLLAIAAQFGLYLGLRQIAVAHRPSWAHDMPHHARPGPLPYPSVVPVDVVHGASASARPGVPALPEPVLSPAPVIDLPPPALGRTAADPPSSADSP